LAPQKPGVAADVITGHDDAIRSLVVAIRQLMEPPPERKKGKIGFDGIPRE